jgi:hypothetical protein
MKVRLDIKQMYAGFGVCHCCKQKRAVRKAGTALLVRWLCRKCWESGER